MSTLAQEEADRLLNPKVHIAGHPEDRHGDHHSDDGDGNGNAAQLVGDNDSDEEDDLDDTADATTRRMMAPGSRSRAGARHHIPRTVYDANTGPKGVIADAQSYERVRQMAGTAGRAGRAMKEPAMVRGTAAEKTTEMGEEEEEEEIDDDDDEFMQHWRQARMQELQQQAQAQAQSQPAHLARKRWGKLETVGATGYLDAVERSPPGTTVVVCIYDPESSESAVVEDCLAELARLHATTRFVRLHHEVAEMDNVTAPAILAYKDGELCATIIDVVAHAAAMASSSSAAFGRAVGGCGPDALAALLMQHRVL
ncbi:hypothetical protein KEM52_001627 [Ascosphaera acerosa]|nr:hypothetical protein KEM52_001627 [Ascosphaera acerosa]